jgi:hypothetical protein
MAAVVSPSSFGAAIGKIVDVVGFAPVLAGASVQVWIFLAFFLRWSLYSHGYFLF